MHVLSTCSGDIKWQAGPAKMTIKRLQGLD